jgi:hypothetical protein
VSAKVSSSLRRFDRRTAIRALAVVAGLAVYYSFAWLPLQRAWQSAFALGLGAIGHDVRALGGDSAPYLLVDGRTFLLSPNCTYIDFVLVLTPLLWRPHRPLRWNAGMLLAVGLFLALFNWTRVLFAIHVQITTGLAWHSLHFWPDFLLHLGLITSVAIWALRTDWRESLAESPGSIQRDELSPVAALGTQASAGQRQA